MSRNNVKNSTINWQQFAANNNLTPQQFIDEIFETTTSILSVQMEEKNIDSISVEMGEYELILKRAKPIQKEYNH